MSEPKLPNLAGVATDNLVEKVVGGSFQASYINWSRTMHLLREHAPGWLPELVADASGDVLRKAPVGGYLLIQFRHADGRWTPPVPQAIMDNRNAAIPFDRITARDITDTHRRGVCMAAALTFGLAYELWAKIPLESGYGDAQPVQEPSKRVTTDPPKATSLSVSVLLQKLKIEPQDALALIQNTTGRKFFSLTDAAKRMSAEDKVAVATVLEARWNAEQAVQAEEPRLES